MILKANKFEPVGGDALRTKRGVSSIFRILGPGILFAAMSVGTSHIVQSTRAGADYGLWMSVVVLFACLVKYPIFRFGTDYAAATGETLIDSYFRQGRWAVAIYAVALAITMFVFTAAVALVTAGLVGNVLGLDLHPKMVTALLFALCAVVLISGRYKVFENVTKAFVVLFMLLILAAVALTLPELEIHSVLGSDTSTLQLDKPTFLFIIALAGFMPTGADAAVFQSLWVCAKSAELGRPMTLREARLDINIGYLVTTFLALCFLLLGTVLMFQSDVAVAESTTDFAGQLISLFTAAIGGFAWPVIAVAVIAVMLSSMFTMVDACPRAVGALVNYRPHSARDMQRETIEQHISESRDHENRYYVPLVLIQCVGATLVLVFFATSFKAFIDFATTVAFLTAPAFAYMNYRAVHSPEVCDEARPSRFMNAWSILSIAILGAVALFYVFFRIVG